LVPPSLLCSTKEPYIKRPIKEPNIKKDVVGPRIWSEHFRPTTVQVAVPDDMVAMIIGKGGEHIKRLQAESGCEIQLPLESPGSWYRLSVCYITGYPEAIAIAQDLIDKKIRNTRFKEARRKDNNICEASSSAGFKPTKISPLPPLLVGGSIEMLVVSADSPSHLVARPVAQEGEYQRMLVDLASASSCPPWQIKESQSRSPPLNISEGAAVAAMVTGRGWLRAEVVALLNPDEDGDNKFQLYLCDLGQFVFLPRSSIHPLSEDFCKLPRLALGLHLLDVIPAGGDEWSKSSKEMLARSFLRQEVEVKVLGPSSLENSSSYLLSHPASICLVQKYAADPVAPAITVRMDMSTSLMDAGYALPAGVLSLLHGDEADDVEQDQVDYDLDMRWG